MVSVSYLRRLKVPIPEEAKGSFPNSEFLRFGISYGKHGGDQYQGLISIYLVPKNGGQFNDFFQKVAEVTLKTENPKDYSTTARRIAKDKGRLVFLLMNSSHPKLSQPS